MTLQRVKSSSTVNAVTPNQFLEDSRRLRRSLSQPSISYEYIWLEGKYQAVPKTPNKVWRSDDFNYNYYMSNTYNPWPYTWTSRLDYDPRYRYRTYYPRSSAVSWYYSDSYFHRYPYTGDYYPWSHPYNARRCEYQSARRAASQYSRGLIGYRELNRYWLAPHNWECPWRRHWSFYGPFYYSDYFY